MKLVYALSETYRKAHFIETGITPPVITSVELDESLLTPGYRAHIVRVVGRIGIPESFHLYRRTYNSLGENKQPLTLDAPASDSQALALLTDDVIRYDQYLVEKADYEAKKAAEEAERRAQHEAYQAREAERVRVQTQEKLAREADKAAWIPAHGSEHLRKAFGAGYNCQRLYVQERATLEHPGFSVDFNDRARWESRSCPSEAALAIAETAGSGALVVWLTRPTHDEGPDWWDEREAVVIREYLGKYDLVREV